MKKEDAKKQIRELWLQRPKSKRTSPDCLIFYFELQKQYSDLLNFRTPKHVDKYQVVSAFIHNLIEE